MEVIIEIPHTKQTNKQTKKYIAKDKKITSHLLGIDKKLYIAKNINYIIVA